MESGQEWERDEKMQIVIVDDDPVMGKQLAEHTERLAKANGIEDIQMKLSIFKALSIILRL